MSRLGVVRPPRLAALVVMILLAGAIGVYSLYGFAGSPTSSSTSSTGCESNYSGSLPLKSNLQRSTAGPLTEFNLPQKARAPNAIAVASDGSVWFGEESLPALAHLFQNGTLLEYVWPGIYPPASATNYSCGFRTQIWGVTLWNGSVWASDASGNQLVSLNPATGRFHFFPLGDPGAFPYYLVAGPEGSLWFTEISPPAIGRLEQNGSSQAYSLPTGIFGTPTQIFFLNSTYALYSDAGQAGKGNGGIYSFDPSHPSFTRLGGTRQLSGITGLAPTPDGFWIGEHGPPYVDFFNYSSASWTDYPTSLVPYSITTLPYFLRTDGSHIWFNEHYGDKIAEIDTTRQSMVEYAISDPPAANLSSISAAQTIARDGPRIWFTALGSNRVGFADFSFPPPFNLTSLSGQEFFMKPNATISLPFQFRGSSAYSVSLKFSDSERGSGVPSALNATSAVLLIPSLSSGQEFTLKLTAGSALSDGTYVFDVTATDGFASYTVFLGVIVQE